MTARTAKSRIDFIAKYVIILNSQMVAENKI